MRTFLAHLAAVALLAAPLLAQQGQQPAPAAKISAPVATAASIPPAGVPADIATVATTSDASAAPEIVNLPQYPYPPSPPPYYGHRHDVDALAVVAVCVTAIIITAMLLHHWGNSGN